MLWHSTDVTLASSTTPSPRTLAADSASSVSTWRLRRLMYGATIFASALLLFEVEPIIAKMILPWFGGVAAVWAVCLVFFQTALLLGYWYADVLTRRFSPVAQRRIHAALLLISLLAIRIVPGERWKPTGPEHPAIRILLLLCATVGLPFFVLSTTSPLLQSWYAKTRRDARPYRLYALSNAGSMLALVSYPILIEPWTSTSHQALGWSAGYVLVVVLCAIVVFTSRNDEPRSASESNRPPSPAPMPAATEAGVTKAAHSAELSRVPAGLRVLWLALAACSSALLLAVTNHITQNIASVPFLWILPLSLYLLSFILCFDARGWYRRGLFLRLLGISIGGMAYALAPSFAGLPWKVMIALFCAGFFVCCMFCHGELERLKPAPEHLTSFYLMVALGGAIGAIFVALIAPLIFSGYYELHVGLALCAILVLVVHYRDPQSPFYGKQLNLGWLVMAGLVVVAIASLFVMAREQASGARLMVRNFYGELRVIGSNEPADAPEHAGTVAHPQAGTVAQPRANTGESPLKQDLRFRKLMNGTIDHGLQFLSPLLRRAPTTYYGMGSGIGIALQAAGAGPVRAANEGAPTRAEDKDGPVTAAAKPGSARAAMDETGSVRAGINVRALVAFQTRPLNVGAIGLGIGTIATYGRPGDSYTFYEINPLVEKVAEQQFTFLRDSPAKIKIVLGDARLSLEREQPQNFDVLVVDAFSGDSIPVHLLTRQAFQLYFRHLKPDGVLAVHISNQYLNLEPVVAAAASALGREAVIVNHQISVGEGVYPSSWILIGSRNGFLGRSQIEQAGEILPANVPASQLWTDDYSSLWRVLK
ncbi:MAG TPA: fused MFS/spermidine synthase [Candidatus Acidoferrales bacterium]|nr:fused MFS/spermidine synthase [Candidatus Acidoferrales bacterium]